MLIGTAWYGTVYGHWADGRARTAPTGFAFPLLPLTKEFLLLQFLIWPACIVQDPQVRRMAVDIIGARILSAEQIPLWCQEFAALNVRSSTTNLTLKYQFLCLKAD